MLRSISHITSRHHHLILSLFPASSPTTQATARCMGTVQIIATTELPHGKAQKGDVLSVRAGYARNFLIPKKKAVYATPENFKKLGISIEEETRSKDADSEEKKAADLLKDYLSNKYVQVFRTADSSEPGSPTHTNVREKHVRHALSKILKIDLESHEKILLNHYPVDLKDVEEENDMDGYLDGLTERNVKIKNLGDYVVKIVLAGGYAVPLKLKVVREQKAAEEDE